MTQLQSSTEVDAFITRLEEESLTKFITFSVDRHYNDKDWQPLPINRVHWQWAGGSGMPAIEFTGIPFMFVGSKRLVCHQGKDLAVAQKRKYFEEKARKMLEDHSFGSQKSRRPSTKKVGCPAAVSISKIATFPKFKSSKCFHDSCGLQAGQLSSGLFSYGSLPSAPMHSYNMLSLEMFSDNKLSCHLVLQKAAKTCGCERCVAEGRREKKRVLLRGRYPVDDNTERSKKTASKMLRMALERDPVIWETRYAVTHLSEHAGHANGRNGTAAASECGVNPRKRTRKSDLRKKCVRLTKQLMDCVHVIEDQCTLEELSQFLSTLLKNLTPLTTSMDGESPHLEAKRARLLSSIPAALSQRCIGRSKSTHSGIESDHAESMQELPS